MFPLRSEVAAVAALGFILVVAIGWWAAALWPLPAATPEWVVRARAACFGATASGLPDAGGWILLLGTPLTMVVALVIIAGDSLRAGLARVAARQPGRVALGVLMLTLVLLAGAAGARVLEAAGRLSATAESTLLAAAELPEPRRLHLPAPPLALLDQRGERVSLTSFRGRPVLVTFAYGRCETVCPLIVRQVLAAQRDLSERTPVVLIVTLDPWRDTPSRLPHIAASWQLPMDAYLLSGGIEEVEAALDAWQVGRARDPRTGEIAHPSLVYLIGREGRLVYVVTGQRGQIVEAARRL